MIKIKHRFNFSTTIAILSLVFVILFFIVYQVGIKNINIYILISFIIFIFSLFVFLRVPQKLLIDNNHLSVSFLFIKKTILLKEIRQIKIEQINALKEFGGFGLRYNLKGDIGYVMSSGYCLKIDLDKESYYISFNKKYLNKLLNNEFIKINQS
jgi:hypothetical protein